MAQKSAKEIRNLNTREPKAWRVIDQFLISKNRKDGKKIPAAVRLEAACFILRRLYPEKIKHSGEGENGEFLIKVEKANYEAGSNIPIARFTVPSLS